ncbi:hypothetical protein GF515_14210, partial [Staphylococcus aureus]|uniref:hypothetical protein n=1 Tax=Staphylococcus aureus TaxID=1280 RepID=UPI0012B0C4BF
MTLQARERKLYTQDTEEMISDELLAKIDELVETKVNKALAGLTTESKPSAVNTVETLSSQTARVLTAEPEKTAEKDWESIPSED